MTRMERWLIVAALAAAAGCGGRAQGPRQVRIQVTDDGFVPAQVVIPKHEAVTLVVTRRTDRTCATDLAGQPDTLRYACGMGMLAGMIIAR